MEILTVLFFLNIKLSFFLKFHLYFLGYVERLISDAIRHGDKHAETMEMANYWIEEKQLVHKLFKVLVPRFQNTSSSYTRMLNAPIPHATPEDSYHYFRSVIELRGNPFPPLIKSGIDNKLLIQNVLLDEAKKEFRTAKYAEIAMDLEAKAIAETKRINPSESRDSVAIEDQVELNSSGDKVADVNEATCEKSSEPK